MDKGGFVFYESFLETAEQLEAIDKKLAYDYVMSIIRFGINGELAREDIDPVVKAMLNPMYVSILAAKERYQQSKDGGEKGGRPRTIDHEEVIRLWQEGKSNKDIAEIVNCSESSVRKIIKSAKEFF